MVQGHPPKAVSEKKKSIAFARQARLKARKASKAVITPPTPNTNGTENQDAGDEEFEEEIECTGWSGEVMHYVPSDGEPILISDDDEDKEVEELLGSELEEVIRQDRERLVGATAVEQQAASVTEETSAKLEATVQPEAESSIPSVIMGKRTNQEWRKAESARSLGYNGQSAQTKRRQDKATRDKETEDKKLRKG